MVSVGSINLKVRFEYLSKIDDILVCHIDAGKLKLEMVMTRELAFDYILRLRVYSTEPRIRNMEN